MNRYKAIGIPLLVLCCTAVGCGIGTLFLAVPDIMKLKACATLLASAAALYYMLKGYSKNAAPAYKAFMGILAVAFQFSAITVSVPNPVYAGILSFCGCLNAGLCLVLSVVEDLGEALSKGMVISVAALRTAIFIASLIVTPATFRGGDVYGMGASLVSSAYATLALIAVAMTYAKYKDKKERGTK